MYKTKLQELCQKNQWPVPRYSWLKVGLDHCPVFKASVIVNDQSFNSASSFKSSKEAQNDAAMHAFFNLESNSTLQAGTDVKVVEDEPPKRDTENVVADQSSDVLDLQCPYKLQLQIYTQKNYLSLPTYSVTSFGPPHACHFFARVTVGKEEFKSVTSSNTAKNAENAAAKAALAALSPDGVDQDFSGYVKNLLQQFAQKEGHSLPIYKTGFTGPVHMRLFYSTVEVGGQVFQGKAGRTKKISEYKAAEVAYRSLEQSKLNQSSWSKPLASPDANSLETKNSSDLENAIEELSSSMNKTAVQASDSAKIIKEQLVKFEPQLPTPESMQTDAHKNLPAENATRVDTSKNDNESGREVTTALSAEDSGSSNETACQSYLISNKVRVYTSIPAMELPKGITLIPIGDYKWVPVSLEFPNEEGI